MSIGVNEESKGLDSSAPGLALVKVEPGRYFLQLSIWFRNFNQQVWKLEKKDDCVLYFSTS